MRPIFSIDIQYTYLLEYQELSEKDSSFPGRVLEMLKWFHLCRGGLRGGSLRGVGRRNRRIRRQEMGRTKVARLSKSNIHIIPYKVDRKPGDPRWPAYPSPQAHHHHSRLVTCLSGKDKLSTEIEVDFSRPLWMNIVHPRLAWLSQPRLSRAAVRLL